YCLRMACAPIDSCSSNRRSSGGTPGHAASKSASVSYPPGRSPSTRMCARSSTERHSNGLALTQVGGASISKPGAIPNFSASPWTARRMNMAPSSGRQSGPLRSYHVGCLTVTQPVSDPSSVLEVRPSGIGGGPSLPTGDHEQCNDGDARDDDERGERVRRRDPEETGDCRRWHGTKQSQGDAVYEDEDDKRARGS